MRLLWLFLGLAVLFLIPFLIWGGALETMFSQTGAVSWMESFGRWAWLGGLGLIVSDLLLPIPGTVVMSAMGYVYGPIWGGLLSAAGSVLAGSIAYHLCRLMGRNAAVRLVGEKDLQKGEAMVEQIGGWVVALSRWLPLLPEVVACMAGLIRMNSLTFHIALLCGALPLGFVFAAIGHAGFEHPLLAIVVSAGLPPLLWWAVSAYLRGMEKDNLA